MNEDDRYTLVVDKPAGMWGVVDREHPEFGAQWFDNKARAIAAMDYHNRRAAADARLRKAQIAAGTYVPSPSEQWSALAGRLLDFQKVPPRGSTGGGDEGEQP